MLYSILKIPATLAVHFYLKNIKCNKPECYVSKGPLLLACNHPNSFLDAIILCSLFDEPIYSLARGDVFKKPLAARILKSLNIYPVYRTREGVENLEQNYVTFDACREIFRKNGIVLIFSEGLCENEWHFRPLKKGTARLAISAWNEGIDLKVLPTGLNYSSFKRFGKNLQLNFGNIITKDVVQGCTTDGQSIVAFNKALFAELSPAIVELDIDDVAGRRKQFETTQHPIINALLAIPAMIGYILHWPLFLPLQLIVRKKALHSGHYDSIIIGVLFFVYPIYLLIISITIWAIFSLPYAVMSLLILPILGWCTLQLRKAVEPALQ